MGPLSQRFGMNLLGRVLSTHLGWSSFSQRHCWATTVHASHKNLFFLMVLFPWLCTAHTPLPSGWALSHSGVPQLSPTPVCVSPPQQQQRNGFVFIPNWFFSPSLFLFWWN